MAGSIRGIIEGFYGTPWTWDQRIEVSQFVAARGMTHYVYAPKDDPKHRDRWRELYSAPKLLGFERLIAEGGLTVGYAIAPGLDIDFDDPADRRAMFAKVDQVVDRGVSLVMLALDDIPFDPRSGPDHAQLTVDLAEHLGRRADLVLVPTEYVGTRHTRYLDALARLVPASIPIGWTGPTVVADHITSDQARQRAEAVGGRAPLLWDNYPVNDGLMADRLFLGPLWGRDADLMDHCCGYLANPMVQPRSSLLPLASIASWLRGEDPLDAWAAEAGPLRILAEACDGAVPQALAGALRDAIDGPEWASAVAAVATWLGAAASCDAPGLDGEADKWLAQVHREAQLGLSALRAVQHSRGYVTVDEHGRGTMVGPDPDAALDEVFNITARWPRVRRGTHTVMGARCSFRPMLGQRVDGGWSLDPASVEADHNAVDAIVRLALDVVAQAADGAQTCEVLVGGEPVAIGDGGAFEVTPGAELVTVTDGSRTAQQAPCGPPVPPTPI